MRELMMAPAHMGQGSRVTYRVHPVSRQEPTAAQATLMASTSAWAVARPSASRRLRPRPIISPSGETMTQPTGTSPWGMQARASFRASCMYSSWVMLLVGEDGHRVDDGLL